MYRLRSLLHIRTENARTGGPRRIIPLFLCCLLLLVGPLYAGHNPLIPRPQQIQYGTARLKRKALKISFGSSPASEDRFAANELATWDAEYEYWRRLQTCLWEVLRDYKDGDTLPSLQELRPRT
jgi:hypothetical protein